MQALNIKQIDMKKIFSAECREYHIRLAEEAEAVAKREKKNKMLTRIPAEYRAGFDSFECPSPHHSLILDNVKKAFADFANGNCVFLCLLGSFGVGKTKLACSFAFEAVERITQKYSVCGYEDERTTSIRYALVSEICEEYERARSFSSAESQTEVIEKYCSADIVILDEIGRTKFFDTEKEIIYRIVNTRERERKTTILVSNLNFGEFGAYVGGAVVDRLKSFGRFPSFMGVPSWRGRK